MVLTLVDVDFATHPPLLAIRDVRDSDIHVGNEPHATRRPRTKQMINSNRLGSQDQASPTSGKSSIRQVQGIRGLPYPVKSHMYPRLHPGMLELSDLVESPPAMYLGRTKERL